MPNHIKVFDEDFDFVQLLLSGDTDSWNRFYKEYRRKLEIFINRKYPYVFSDIVIEEIFDGVGKRLIENDFKSLRNYRGECSFSSYITKATEWEIMDWLRRHSDELMDESIDAVRGDDKVLIASEEHQFSSPVAEQDQLPDAIKSLTDDLRFAFLLRYYDYFGFPLDEIRLLANKKRVSIGSITEKLVKLLEPSGDNILLTQREKQMAFQKRLEKVCYEIHKLNIKEHKLADTEFFNNKYVLELQEVSNERMALEKKREEILKEKIKYIVTTPYEVIADIVGEFSASTIRSRVYLAKKHLAQRCKVRE